MDPKIVFADEPTNDLDEGRAQWVEDYLLSLPDNGCAVVVVTHDAGFIKRIPVSYKIENRKLVCI